MKKTQLLLITGDHPTYEDGDILVAWNSRRIKEVHASHICWPRINDKKVGGMTHGLFPLLEEYLSKSYQYRFDRVSDTEIIRLDLITGVSETIGKTPNVKGEAIDVKEFIARRKKFGKLPLFGLDGRERWYGGTTRNSEADIDNVWVSIKEKTGKKPKDHEDYEFTPAENKEFFRVDVDDTTNEESSELTSPLIDEDAIVAENESKPTLKKRKHSVKWRNIKDVDVAKALDKKIEYTKKDPILKLKDVVKTKVKI